MRERFSFFPKKMAEEMSGAVEKICFGAYRQEIPLLALRTFSALGKADAARSIEIGAAHCFGWTAYRLFDRCADEKSGKVAIAVALHRLMVSGYERSLAEKDVHCMESILASSDAANYMEEEARDATEKDASLPPFGLLAAKSRGHSLAVLVPLMISGYGTRSAEYDLALDMMDATIVARQLSDDMRDWQEDLDSGIVTRVNYPLFKKADSADRDNGAGLRASMSDACVDMIRHAEKAARLARMNPAFKDPGFFVRLADTIARPARNFLTEHRQQ